MEVWEKIITYLISNYPAYLMVVLVVTMSTIFGILTLLKKPIKKLTSKIKNEKIRKLANKSIIVLSFILSISIWALLNHLMPQYFDFNIAEIMLSGALPVVVYALVDGVITKDKANNLVDSIIDFVDTKQKTEPTEKKETAEEKLNNLIHSIKE